MNAPLEPIAPRLPSAQHLQFILPGGGMLEGKLLPNESVAHAAVRIGIDLRMSCGGHETCSSCQMTRDGRALKSCQERVGGVYEVQLIALHDTAVQIISDSEIEHDVERDPVLRTVELRPEPATFAPRPVQVSAAAPSSETQTVWVGDDLSRLQQALEAAGVSNAIIPPGLIPTAADLLAPRAGVTPLAQLTATVLHTGNERRLIALQPTTAEAPVYAVAIDLGTTTVVAELVDCRTGEVLITASAGNAQVRLAEDVASRISVARDRLAELHALVVKKTLQPLCEKLAAGANITAQQIGAVVVSGNTVMTHLLYGWPTDGLGHVPFHAVSLTPPIIDAAQAGLKLHPQAKLIAAPSMSGYVGGDLMSGLLVTRLHEKTHTTALIDVGTNAEMLLVHKGKIYGTSTPAGPSFEGGGIRWGVRARAGAIEHIRITETGLSIQTIGNAPAVGVCGSGLVDLLAEGLRSGLLTPAGRFQGDHPNLEWIPPKTDVTRPSDSVPDERGANPRDNKKAPRRRLVLARADQSRPGYGPLYITEGEIAQLLQAKAAIFSGFHTLLQAVGIGINDIDELLLAGGFARHIDLRSAVGCGMLPDVRNIQVVGNTSLAGSLRMILHHHALTTMKQLMHSAQIVELNLEPTFEQNFIDALFLPNVNKKLFPSVPPAPPRRPSPPPPDFAALAAARAVDAANADAVRGSAP